MYKCLIFFALMAMNTLVSENQILVSSIAEQGIVAKLYRPVGTEKAPAIIVLGGSEGGFNECPAQLFAENGYVALALAYFQAEGLPDRLEHLPLEYFMQGVAWLQAQPFVDAQEIHLYGPSKGGELVLVLCSLFPETFKSAIAVVPSCVVYGGIPDHQVSSWSYKGLPLPFAPTPGKEDVMSQLKTRNTVDLTTLFLEKSEDQAAFENALIKVENIDCPLLLISGQEDRIWPSSFYAERVMERLDLFQSPIPREHLCYEGVGHMITSPLNAILTQPFKHPVTGLFYEIGGEPEAQAKACDTSWKAILNFIQGAGSVSNMRSIRASVDKFSASPS